MLSAMMTERVGLGFWKAAFGIGEADSGAPLLRNIVDSMLKPICLKDGPRAPGLSLKLTQDVDFAVMDETVGKPSIVDLFAQEEEIPESGQANYEITRNVVNHCGSLQTLADFLNLVKNLYAIGPQLNKSV